MSDLVTGLGDYLPALAALAAVAAVLALGQWLLLGRKTLGTEARLPRQLAMLLLTLAGILLVVLLLPMSDSTRGQVLSLIGIVLTGVIALSSTTFVSNAMAGLMLRVVGSFRPGDFVSVGEQFGRVTERGLFHTEIQTEDRDLTTIPNLYLVTNPVNVVHFSGTMISTTLSLGYDLAHGHIEELLKTAAEEAGLEEPYVQVRELGDFSVTYRVAGFLKEVKHLLTARSNLRREILDVLHGAGVEIVSPTFMNQRRLADDAKVIPEQIRRVPPRGPEGDKPEERIFDKAEEAGERESQRDELHKLTKEREELREALKTAAEEERPGLEKKIESLDTRIGALDSRVNGADEKKPDDPDRRPDQAGSAES